MLARMDFVNEQIAITTRESAESCLEHLLDMLRLCRSDNVGARATVPSLFLRLRRDQEAYDFMKWYATTGRRSTYDWTDMASPYLNLTNEDVMEPVEGLFLSSNAPSHPVAVLLLKLRMLLDLQDLSASSILFEKEKLNFDVAQRICKAVTTRSPIWANRSELLELENIH
jgi:hypothetical protein